MLTLIQADSFIMLRYTKRCKQFHDSCADQRADNCDRDRNNNTDKLCNEQMVIAKNKTIPSRSAVDGLLRKYSGCNTAPDTSDSVTAKSIQRIVIAKMFLDDRHHEIADWTDYDADNKCGPQWYKSCSWCDCDQTKYSSEPQVRLLRERFRH